jgi:hypothetical protein
MIRRTREDQEVGRVLLAALVGVASKQMTSGDDGALLE